MAKKSIIAREVKRARLVAKFAEKRAELKKAGNWDELDKLPLNSNPNRMHNRCMLTGRPKGYMRQFGICRNQFRELANNGMIPGVRKCSF